MIKALLLIFDPTGTWERIDNSKPSVLSVLFLYVLPIMLVCFALEGWLILKFGVEHGRFAERIVQVPRELVIRYEVVQFAFGLVICFIGGWLFQHTAEGFHRRHSFTEGFTALGYSLGPYFILRILDGWPAINTWISWAIGVVLAISVLYRGIPRAMKPDPSNALGLYLLCSLWIISLTGLAHFITTLVLDEKILTNLQIPKLI